VLTIRRIRAFTISWKGYLRSTGFNVLNPPERATRVTHRHIFATPDEIVGEARGTVCPTIG
jgi:hypothetical protein